MTVVWAESRHKGSALLLLLALADYAHDDGGHAFPSVPTMARRVRMTERAVQLLLAKLKASGELVADGVRDGGTVVYRIVLPGLQAGGEKFAPPPRRGVHRRSPGGDRPITGGVQPGSPDPSLTPQEPSGVDSAALAARVQVMRRRFRGDDRAWAALTSRVLQEARLFGWTEAQFLAHLEAAAAPQPTR